MHFRDAFLLMELRHYQRTIAVGMEWHHLVWLSGSQELKFVSLALWVRILQQVGDTGGQGELESLYFYILWWSSPQQDGSETKAFSFPPPLPTFNLLSTTPVVIEQTGLG